MIQTRATSINHVDGFLDIFDPPSPLCGQTWSLDKPTLKTMWIFMLTSPLYFKNIGMFLEFLYPNPP